MKAGNIVLKNSRLLFFRALEEGVERKFFNEDFLSGVKKEGVELSFTLAERQYSVIHEAFLRQAVFNVLGIVNLGLAISAEESVDQAILFVKEKGLVGLFRQGWTHLFKLARDISLVDDIKPEEAEVDLAEDISAEPGKQWMGLEVYQRERQTYSAKVFAQQLNNWLINSFSGSSKKADEVTCQEKMIDTIIFSALISKPHSPLFGDEDLNRLCDKIKQLNWEEAKKEIESVFKPLFPKKLKKGELAGKSTEESFRRYKAVLKEGGMPKLKIALVWDLCIEHGLDAISEAQYQAFASQLKEEQPNVREILDFYLINADDSQVLAIIHYLFSERRNDMNAELVWEALQIIPSNSWRGEIDWVKLGEKRLSRLLNNPPLNRKVFLDAIIDILENLKSKKNPSKTISLLIEKMEQRFL